MCHVSTTSHLSQSTVVGIKRLQVTGYMGSSIEETCKSLSKELQVVMQLSGYSHQPVTVSNSMKTEIRIR